jgi:hypothetical protein
MERRSPERVVLLYASEWDDAAAAKRYLRLYRQVLEKKWKHIEVKSEGDDSVAGVGDDGYFLVQVTGAVVTSVEGAENPVTLQ